MQFGKCTGIKTFPAPHQWEPGLNGTKKQCGSATIICDEFVANHLSLKMEQELLLGNTFTATRGLPQLQHMLTSDNRGRTALAFGCHLK